MFDEIDIFYTVGESVEWCILLWKTVWKFSFLKKCISFDPAFATLGFRHLLKVAQIQTVNCSLVYSGRKH